MRKGFAFAIFMFFVSTMLSAQNISVAGFKLLDTDLTAITQGTQEIDQNGEVAALIKVVTTETGFSFDIGSLGIVKTHQAVGEIWVYVPKRAQKISIFHQKYGVIRNYYFPVPIESGRSYELKLDVQKEKQENETTSLTDDEMAYRAYRTMAQEGDASSLFYTGLCLYKGKGVAQNYVEAVECFLKAAEKNDSRAQYYLGLCYENGFGVQKSLTDAYSYYKTSADNGNKAAYYNLADFLYYGKGVEKDYSAAYNWCRKSADSNDDNAYFLLGEMYYLGQGVKRNYKEAFKCFDKAKETDNRVALVRIGNCFQLGHGTKKDEEEAVRCYKQAAEQGCSDAQYYLALCHEQGIGIEKNPTMAYNLYKKAADAENLNAIKALGFCFSEGIGVNKDSIKAAIKIQNYIDLGGELQKEDVNKTIRIIVNILKENENHKELDCVIKILKKCIEYENAEAMMIMGFCLNNGIGVQQDRDQANKLFNKALNSAKGRFINIKELNLRLE